MKHSWVCFASSASASIASGQAILLVPDEHPTIQAAIDAAQSGDTVLVDVGTYVEDVVVRNVPLLVRSRYGAEHTHIVSPSGTSTVSFQPLAQHDTVLDGFTIRGGGPRWRESFDADPQWVAAPSRDFHLRATSLCRDASTRVLPNLRGLGGSPEEDFEGDRRWIGPTPDVGVDELALVRALALTSRREGELHALRQVEARAAGIADRVAVPDLEVARVAGAPAALLEDLGAPERAT